MEHTVDINQTAPLGTVRSVSTVFPQTRLIDGWMTCDFTSFSTVFQYDGRMIMKDCVQ